MEDNMCGIAGYISEKRWNDEQMLKSIEHRGPDGHGLYTDRIGDRNIVIGHTRLSIIDLSDNGKQPMVSPEGNVIISYNGEVYNFQELKNKYLSNIDFTSKTDTEVLLHLYLKLGESFVSELNGAFAISFYDKRSKELLLYRDRFGIKPLYFYKGQEGLFFGSEPKSFIAAGIRLTMSEDQLQNYLVFKYVPGNNTLFNKVERVAPGTYLKVNLTDSKIESKRYYAHKEDEFVKSSSYTDMQNELKSRMNQAVERRLIADVPLSTFLSGGVDSSIIASHLKDRSDILHFCARKDEKDVKKEGTTSDYAYAEKLANSWGLNFSPVDIGSEELSLEMLRKTLHYSDDLIADGSQIPSYLITEEAGKKTKVVLMGMGADEIFLGYAGHMLTLMSQRFDNLPGFVSKSILNRFSKIEAGKGKFKAYKRYLYKIGKYYHYPEIKYGLYSIVGDYESSLSVLKEHDDSTKNYISPYFESQKDPFEGLKHFERDNFMVKNLHYSDRMCMANGMENRVPFLDHEIVELAYAIPRKYKLSNGGTSKKILKDTYRNILPDYVVKRRKAGFGMPLRSIFAQEEKVRQLLEFDFLESFDQFSIEQINQVIKNHVEGKEDHSALIYALLSFQEWYKMYIKS